MNFTYCFPTQQGQRAEELIKGSEFLLAIYHLNEMLVCNYGTSEDDCLIEYLLEGQ